jgi:hypothetical protein
MLLLAFRVSRASIKKLLGFGDASLDPVGKR